MGANGLFAVKDNQKKLLRACQRRSRFAPRETAHYAVEKSKGCVIERITTVWSVPKSERQRFWNTFASVLHTQRIKHFACGKTTREVVWHVTTAPVSAGLGADLIRSHWTIENRWHGLRDIGFHEDASQATGLAARGLALIRSIAITLARLRRTEPNKAQRERWRDPRKLWAWYFQ